MSTTEKKIAMNSSRRPNMGVATEQSVAAYDLLMAQPWLAQMVDEIRGGNEALKKELPFRAAHYSRFADNRRTQKNAAPESFLFQTTVDVDDPELVETCIERAKMLDADEGSPWHGMLLRAEYSARGKVHFDILMPIGMTIAETQRAYCEALGYPEVYDKACTTPERIIYITDRRQEIYRSARWAVALTDEELAVRRKAYADRGLTIDGREPATGRPVATATSHAEEASGASGQTPSSTSTLEGVKVVEATPVSLRAFELCVKAAGLDASAMDVWGEHNWHSNLMAVLSVGLPKLMKREQLLAVVRARLPNYSQTDDCAKLIEYFYQKYAADKGFMSVTLRQINAMAQKEAGSEMPRVAEMSQDDKDVAALTQSWLPPELPKKLPRLMELLVSNYDPRYREMLLMAALPVLSAHASHFRARYINGRIIGPQQYVAVIGGSGKGKGNATELYKEMIEYTLQENDDREWAKVKENTELRDQKANAKERPPKYHPRLRLFETTSKSSILDLQTNLGRNGMLLGQFSEVDGLSSASRTAYSDISVILRKGWDLDFHRQYYMSDATCNAYAQMSISLLMAGTVRAMLERMFSDNNCEGGLMQRCIPVVVPRTKRTFRPPIQNFLNEDEKKERDALMIELYQKDLDLGDDTQLLETPLVNRAIGQWYDELEVIYNDGMMTEAEADLSHRCGEFMLRAAIPLIALYDKETKEIVDFCRWVGEMAHYTMCRLFGYRVQKDITASEELLSEHLDSRRTAEPLLDKMPGIFTLQQFKEARVKAGQSPDVKMILSRYVKNGKLERIGRGVYRKVGFGIVEEA